MVRRPLPAAALLQDRHPVDAVAEALADPDVVEPSALVGLGPVGRAVAPPRVAFLVRGDDAAQDIDPGSGGEGVAELLDLDRRVAETAASRRARRRGSPSAR